MSVGFYKPYMKNILIIVVFILAFIAVKYGIQEYRNRVYIDVAEEEYEQMQATAKKNYPDRSHVEAIYQAATEISENKISNIKSEQEKMQYAANAFFGYYFINTRSRNTYCKTLGIDLTPFINAVTNYNKSEYQKAINIYKQVGVDKEELWSALEPLSIKMLKQDMQSIAEQYQLTLKETCRAFAENPEIASEMTFAKRASASVYHVLMDTKQTN